MISYQPVHKNKVIKFKKNFVKSFNHVPTYFGASTAPSSGQRRTLGNKNTVHVKTVSQNFWMPYGNVSLLQRLFYFILLFLYMSLCVIILLRHFLNYMLSFYAHRETNA